MSLCRNGAESQSRTGCCGEAQAQVGVVQSSDWPITDDAPAPAVAPSARRHTTAASCSDHFFDFSL